MVLFCEQLILLPNDNSVSFQTARQHFHFRQLRNIFISDGSATFSFQTAPQHFISYGIRTEMVVTYMDTL